MKTKPFSLYVLVILMVLQSLGALFGGILLVAAPSGSIMKMPLEMLHGSPFQDFLIPGLILMVLLGILPGILAYALLARPVWRFADVFNVYKGIHWAWTYSLYLGIMLVIWILVEIVWIDYDILQTVYGLLGVVILVTTLLPASMRWFGWKTNNN